MSPWAGKRWHTISSHKRRSKKYGCTKKCAGKEPGGRKVACERAVRKEKASLQSRFTSVSASLITQSHVATVTGAWQPDPLRSDTWSPNNPSSELLCRPPGHVSFIPCRGAVTEGVPQSGIRLSFRYWITAWNHTVEPYQFVNRGTLLSNARLKMVPKECSCSDF